MQKNTETTRRAILGAIAATPVAALPAIAPPIDGDLFPALAVAIERHKVARAAIEAHSGLDDLPEQLTDDEDEAALAIVVLPCANDAQLLAKLRYLLRYEIALWGDPNVDDPHQTVAFALDYHERPDVYEA